MLAATTLFSVCQRKRRRQRGSQRRRLRSSDHISLTVAAGAVEALHAGVLGLPVRELQRGVQAPEAFSQGVVLVVLDELLDAQKYEAFHIPDIASRSWLNEAFMNPPKIVMK